MRITKKDGTRSNMRVTTLGIALAAIALLAVALILTWTPVPTEADDTTPASVGVSVTGETSASIIWQAVENAKDYRVKYAPVGENYRPRSDTDWNKFPTGTSVDLTNLEAGTQ